MAKRSPWLRWTLAGAALVIAAAISAPFLVPLSRFIPQLTELAAKALGQPVAIADLRLQLLPTPHVSAYGVRVGKREEVKIEELHIVPDLMSLLSGRHAVSEIRADKVELKEAALAFPGKMPKGGETMVVIRRVSLRHVKLQHSAFKLPEFDLDMELGADLQPEQALFRSLDGALRLTLDPVGAGRANVQLVAKRWRLPLAAAPLTFDSLKAEGVLAGKRLSVATIEGKLYGGTLAASARADWTRQWQVAGKANVAAVDVARVQQALGSKPRLSGRLNADASFSSSANLPEQLGAALQLDGSFNVVGGEYRGVDLAKVGDLAGSKGAGGSTRFDELRGVLQLRGKQIRVHNLCARSSALVAAGFVEVAPDQTLSGRLGVSVAKTGGFLGVPVALSGTAQDPVVRPTKGYTIGAVVGTVLLPGVGTALGAYAGSAIEGRAGDCR